ETALAGVIDRLVEYLVLEIVTVGIVAHRCIRATLMGGTQSFCVFTCMTARSMGPGHPLELRHHVEHLEDVTRSRVDHHGAAPRPDLDQADGAELHQGFPDRGSRDTEACGELALVQAV